MYYGKVHIPENADLSKSAYYTSPSWEDVKDVYQIQMYLTTPDGNIPIDKPTVGLKISTA
jgi:hypothetical protein